MHDDVTRPRLHFTAQSGWINDPLGLTLHDGRCHVFYQYVPDQTVWTTEQCWGHATSEDLLHWTEGEVALAPGDGDDGVWSGCLVVPDDGPAALFYTTVERATAQIGRARLARPVDETWTAWTKHDVVAELPDGVDAVEFRDPYVVHDGKCWRMIIGTGLADGTAAALSYVSDDLESWSYDGILASRHGSEVDPVRTGVMWECPQLFRLADRWVLAVSVWEPGAERFEAYAVGDLVEGRFVAKTWARLSYGPSYYAASAFADDGAAGLVYWLVGVADPAGRWTGAHSVPHRLELEGGLVVARPHPAVAAARRGDPVTFREGSARLPWVADLEWTLGAQTPTGTLTIGGDRGGDADVQALLEVGEGRLVVRVGERSWTMPTDSGDLRVVLDGPVMEVFGVCGTVAVPLASTSETRTISVSGDGWVTAHALR